MEVTPHPAPVREGDVLAKKYRVEKVLGIGGMGLVVSALHLRLDQRVALKFLLPSMLGNPEVVERFAREARAAARIKSEHVARVIDVGELDSGSPYMVMEFLEGEDLAAVLAREGSLAITRALACVLQACDAIGEAHSVGIIHRDLKPANLFLARRPDKTSIVKVLDFGISKAIDPAMALGTLTQTQALVGSPLYMSPEQLTAPKTIDARSDIWALGVILYELLSGAPPFVAETLPELIAAVLANKPTPLTRRRNDIAPPLAGVVERCLSKDRNDRPSSVAALAGLLAPFAAAEHHHLAERVSRVMGEPLPSTPKRPSGSEAVRIAPVKLATSFFDDTGDGFKLLTEAKKMIAAKAATRITMAQSSWGKTHSAPPAPPVHPIPFRLIVGGLLAVSAFAIVVLGTLHLQSTRLAPAADSSVVREPAAASSAEVAAPSPSTASIPLLTPGDLPSTLDATTGDRPAPTKRLGVAAKTTIIDAGTGCNPPYWLDADAVRHYRPECMAAAQSSASAASLTAAPVVSTSPADPTKKIKMEIK